MLTMFMFLSFCFSKIIEAYDVQRIQYAKTKSDCIAREEGTENPKEKRKKQEEKGELFHCEVLAFCFQFS